MLNWLTPHLRIENVEQLTLIRLRELGVESLLLDLDCTIKRYRATEVRPEAAEWLKGLQAEGIGCCIVSNGLEHRARPIADKLGLPFVAKALKPLPFGVHKAMRKMGFRAERTAMVGDQLFADVMAGRLAGIRCVLVRPFHPEDEPWFTRMKRGPERVWLGWLEARGRGNAD
jgi:uncharacterized protein